jgi:putative MATE family efflux protein
LATPLDNTPGTVRPLLRLALPVLLEQLLVMLINYADTALAGQYLGKSELAAIGLMYYAVWLLQNVFSLVAIGSAALVARFVGSNDMKRARRVTEQSLLAGAALSLVMIVLVALGARSFVELMQLSGDSAEMATEYLWIVAPVLPFMMLEVIIIACLRGAGDTVTGLLVMAIVVVINLAVSWSLVAGLGPFPALGWTGLAIGTATAHFTGGVLLLATVLRRRSVMRLSRSVFRPDIQLMRRILRTGVPGGIDILLITFCHLWYLSIINAIGATEAAAHGIGVKIESLAYLPGFAFQVAAATMVGQALGAKDSKQAERAVLTGVLTGGGVMTAAALLFFFVPGLLVGLFVSGDSNAEVITTTIPLLRIAAISTPPLALLMIVGGALRGAGDTRVPLVLNLVGFLGVRIPGAYWLAYGLGWGLVGAWWAMVADVMVRCALILLRYRHGGWKRMKV